MGERALQSNSSNHYQEEIDKKISEIESKIIFILPKAIYSCKFNGSSTYLQEDISGNNIIIKTTGFNKPSFIMNKNKVICGDVKKYFLHFTQ